MTSNMKFPTITLDNENEIAYLPDYSLLRIEKWYEPNEKSMKITKTPYVSKPTLFVTYTNETFGVYPSPKETEQTIIPIYTLTKYEDITGKTKYEDEVRLPANTALLNSATNSRNFISELKDSLKAERGEDLVRFQIKASPSIHRNKLIEILNKSMENRNGKSLKGSYVPTPQRKRAAPKKGTPAVRVNVRKMF